MTNFKTDDFFKDIDFSNIENMQEQLKEKYKDLQENFNKKKEELKSIRTDITNKKHTITSEKHLFDLTLNHDNTIESIKFKGSLYKNIPTKQLESIIIDTFNKAKGNLHQDIDKTIKSNDLYDSKYNIDNILSDDFKIEDLIPKEMQG